MRRIWHSQSLRGLLVPAFLASLLLTLAHVEGAVATGAPAPVGALTTRVGDTAVKLTWAMPPEAQAVIVRRSIGSPPAAPEEGEPVEAGRTEALDTGLLNGTSYSYSLWTVGPGGRLGSAATVNGLLPAIRPRTTLTLSTSPAAVTYGAAVGWSARLTQSSNGAPLEGEHVELWAAPAGTWTKVATADTGADGIARASYKPVKHSDLQARASGSLWAAPSTSPTRHVDVALRLTVHAGTSARVGTTMPISGTVSPAHPGRPVTLWRLDDGAWRALATHALTSSSSFTFTVTPRTTGWWRYRITTASDADHRGSVHTLAPVDSYRLHTYVVTSKGSIVVDMKSFAAAVALTYSDGRGWLRSHRRFQQVSSGGSFTVVLSEARYVPSFSSACDTTFSCHAGGFVIINQTRWRSGSRAFTDSLSDYRQMVVNHETGHWLGLGHAQCPRSGAPAPVMQQQSANLQGCAPNPWPLPAEIARASS